MPSVPLQRPRRPSMRSRLIDALRALGVRTQARVRREEVRIATLERLEPDDRVRAVGEW